MSRAFAGSSASVSFGSLVLAALIVLSPPRAEAGEVVVVPVAQDESVVSGTPDKNLHDSSVSGGLFTGVDGGVSGSAHFYLKFLLPARSPGAVAERATLLGYYASDFHDLDDGLHAIEFVQSDLWTEETITWANQPGPAYGFAEAAWDAAANQAGTEQALDLTAIVQQEFAGDGVLSLQVKAFNEGITSENNNWEYFVEKEFDPMRAFRLEMVVHTPVQLTVPLPPAGWAGLMMLGAIGAVSAIRTRMAR
ncbi:MAG: DNRLRE domain-containing protein [Tepidisphaeraceae bacterium]